MAESQEAIAKDVHQAKDPEGRQCAAVAVHVHCQARSI